MTTPTPVGPAREPDRLTAALVGWKRPFAWLLVAVGLACLLASGYCFSKGMKGSPPATDVIDPPAADKPKDESATRNPKEFLLGGAAAFLAAWIGAGGGGYLLGGLPRLPGATQPESLKAEAYIGGALGLLLMLLGLGLFVLWFGTTVEWTTKKYSADAWKVVTALLVFVVGCGLAFAATQLLRAEERTSEWSRRVAFGAAAALSVVFLLVGLAVANVIVALKVPESLDTTASGYYTLQPETTELIKALPVNVTVYTTFNESEQSGRRARRLAQDLARLLDQCRAANPQRFQLRPLSLLLNKEEIAKLQDEHAEFKRTDPGLLVVTDGKPGKFLSYAELEDANRQTGQVSFVGEPKVVSLLLSLTADQDRTVYFLQGHGEISVGPKGGEEGPRRTGLGMAVALERVDTIVKPLTLDLVNPKVPDDAAVVVIADPREAIPPEQLAALKEYMTAKRKNDKLGKLLVLSSPSPNVNGKGVRETGLNALIGPYGVSLGNSYTYFIPTSQLEPTESEVFAVRMANQAVNPVVMQFREQGFVFPNCREVNVARQPGKEVLFGTAPDRWSWLEADRLTNPVAAMKEMSSGDAAKAAELQAQKNLRQDFRYVAAAASDEKAPRVVVFGSGDAFADPATSEAAAKVRPNAALLATAVNWLRDRPTAANVTGKNLTEYQINRNLDGFKGLLLPVFGTLIAVVALGLGVWAYRRK